MGHSLMQGLMGLGASGSQQGLGRLELGGAGESAARHNPELMQKLAVASDVLAPPLAPFFNAAAGYSRGGPLGGLAGGAGSFLGQNLGPVIHRALGFIGNGVGSAATQPLAGGASIPGSAIGAVSDPGAAIGSAVSETTGAAPFVSPGPGEFIGGGSSPIGQGLGATNSAITVTGNPGATVGARIGSNAGAATGSLASGLDRPNSADQPGQTEATKNNSNGARDTAMEAGKALVNQGLSALTAPKGVSGAPSATGGNVRPAAGGAGVGGLGGLPNSGALRPSIYPWTQAAS